MGPSLLEKLGSAFFCLAVLHTFSVKSFQHASRRYRKGSVLWNLFHLLGEVEIVFGVWAALLVVVVALAIDVDVAVRVVEDRDFTEPLFVFAIMTIAATRPIVALAQVVIQAVARALPGARERRFYVSALVVGPLLGSLITEPAAMTVTALVLRERFFGAEVSRRFKYLTIGTLFVNVSIGGLLTHFAAPPVLMVTRAWNWDSAYMLTHFGWKAAIAVVVNATLVAVVGGRDLAKAHGASPGAGRAGRVPPWLMTGHALLLALVVATSHHPAMFIGVLLLFLGVSGVTKEYQEELKLKESLLVACFLAGLVVLGSLQSWWLKPLISGLGPLPMFIGAATLTSVTDNAALTFLGSQIPGFADGLKYALVAGAVAGGGLTVIANAPNPAGFAILRDRFGPEGISAWHLFLGALMPTVVALLALGLL